MLFSVIVPVYKVEKYLSGCIESVLNQTFSDWELIMCDDGSKDDTYAVAETYRAKYPDKIVLIKNEENKGLRAK